VRDRSIPGAESGPVNWESKLRHRHTRDTGASCTLTCPGCGWVSQAWMVGCGECFQMAAVDYGTHLLARHMDDALAEIMRIEAGR
jgi:hypothetical protein